jgi:5,10-methylenetetrahydromethanopterin reductase
MSASVMLSGNGDLDSTKVADISSKAEMKGFDGLWFGETTMHDASVLATVAACATRKIQLGTSIVNVFTRTPGQLAMMGATISQLSNGRFTLGLGVSSAPIVENWHGQRFDKPVQRLDETVRLLRQYFSGERFSHHGAFCSPTNAILRTKSSPRIALAALNDRMVKKAGALADRVILNLYPTERIAHAVELVEEGQRSAGKKEKPTLSVMLYAHVLGHDEKGLEAAKDLVAFYASSPAYSALFSSMGFRAEAKAMMEAWKARNRESVRRIVTRQIIDRIMVLGTVHDLRERVKLYHESGVDDVLISPSPFREFEANVNEILGHYF